MEDMATCSIHICIHGVYNPTDWGASPALSSQSISSPLLTGDTGGGVATREPGVGVMQGETLRLRIWGKCKPGDRVICFLNHAA